MHRLISRACLILMICLVSISEALAASPQNVTVNAEKCTLQQLFKMIEQQTTYHFSYDNDLIDNKPDISINMKAVPATKVLDTAFKGRDLAYNILSNNTIVVSRKKSATGAKSAGKKVLITGQVLDDTGEPILGATVRVKDSDILTITNIDGDFSLDAPENSELIVTYIGYAPTEAMAKGNEPLSIVMKEDNNLLDEVVVVGYGVQKKANLSGAVASVSTKQLENRPVLNVGQALQGTVANMNVSVGSGQATSTPSFNIRGTTSINGGSPLIVIDGAASDAATLNRMNPNDIENISVLKDAASCAIYGARAAYGVILVTTKTGSDEKLAIHYNNNFTWRKNTFDPFIETDPYTVATMRNQAYYPWGVAYNEEAVEYAKMVSEDPTISPYRLMPDGTYQYWGRTNWLKEAYKPSSFATTHSVDLSGRTDLVDYYFSAGYSYQNGMLRQNTDKYNRYNLNNKLNFRINKWWSLNSNINVITYDYKAPTNLDTYTYWNINRIAPTEVLRNPDGSWTYEGSKILGLLSDGGQWEKYETQVRATLGTRIDIIKDVLWAQGNFTYSTDKYRTRWQYLPVAYKEGPDTPVMYRNPTSSAYAGNSDDKDIYIDVYATFHKTFGKHDVTVMGGYNQTEYEYYGSNLSRAELISTSVPTACLATGDMEVGESISSKATRSGFGRIGYIFDNKYIVEFNGRYDGTSSFPKKDRFVFSPSASAGWVISRESFFEPLSTVISHFKIRGSYGRLGNQDVGYYPYIASMGDGKLSNIIDGKQPVYVSAPGLVSGSLTWEKVTTENIGADLNFFNNRLNFTGEYYVRRTKDMLTAGRTLPGVLGTSVPKANAADLKTKGWELTISYNDNFIVGGKPLNFSASFNIADSRAWITKFDNPNGNLNDYYEGYEIGSMWGLTTLGFFTSDEDVANHANQNPVTSYPGTPPVSAGDLKFADLDGDGIINGGAWTLEDHGDYRIIGNSRNRYTYGLNLNAGWNGIDLSVFFQGVGKKNYYPGASDPYFWGIYLEPWTNINYANLYDHWTEDNPNGYLPRMKSYVAYQSGIEAAATQTKYLQNARYLRLKNLQVGYTLPQNICSKMGINRFRVFFSGDNLAVWSGLYKHYDCDPEDLGGQGYPLQKAFSFGMNVTF